MASSAHAAALLVPPFPSSSSSDDSDDAKTLPAPPVLDPEVASPPPQQQLKLQRCLDLERDCNLAMKALARAGDVDQVVDLFSELMLSAASAGAAPSVLCYNTLLNAQAEAGRAAETRMAFDGMLAAGVAPNASSFNILVKLYAWRTAEFHLAYDEIHGMRRHGVVPDVATYSTLVTGLCRVGKLDEAWGVLDWMLQEGCRPMVHTCTPIVQGYCCEGRIEEARKLIDFMEDAGCPPNAVTYNVLIRALSHFPFREEHRVNQCAAVVAYNTVMIRLCDMDRWSGVLELLADMIKKGISPNMRTFNIFIHSLCIRGKLSVAKNLVYNQGFPANVVTYNTLIHWFYYHGKDLLTVLIKRLVHSERIWNIIDALREVERQAHNGQEKR
ncbi:Pentatricopeptide repeat-containing protein [Dichanthelium oligosanthes]|uniref:Pentatricopeptide repeat-containing protein n=1 Tax=Dichanthelium oligosanthes TaxID=888268 RepID=A0A1E5WI88_9POAL|nr:Pentatricopeptide repeat-containing protein [Dichanthelium oligosanthes]